MDILEEHHASEVSKHRYFLLGIAASAIAFAFHETADRALTPSLAVIGAAILAWAASFGCGLKANVLTQHAILLNRNVNRAESKREVPDSWVEKVRGALSSTMVSLKSYFNWQMYFLPIGAVLYLTGHIMFLTEQPAPKAGVPAYADVKPGK